MKQYQPSQPKQATGDFTAWMVNPTDYREEQEEIRRAELLVQLEQLKIRSRKA